MKAQVRGEFKVCQKSRVLLWFVLKTVPLLGQRSQVPNALAEQGTISGFGAHKSQSSFLTNKKKNLRATRVIQVLAVAQSMLYHL